MNKRRLTSVLMLLLAAVVLFAFERQIERTAIFKAQEVQKEQVRELATELQLRMVSQFSQDLRLLYGLRAFIESNPDFSEDDYAKYAASIKRYHPEIRNIAAAPDLIVRYVYPYEENKAALGLNYREGPTEQKAAVYKSIREGKAVIAGPVTLVQGGEALILRLPVYLYQKNGSQSLWGMISAPIDVETIYRKSGLSAATEDYDVALRGKDGLGVNGDVFYGDAVLFSSGADVVKFSIPFENGLWVMAMRPKAGWVTTFPEKMVTRVAFICLFVVLIILWHFAEAYLKERLEIQKQKEQALKEKSEFLEILSHEIRAPLQGVLAAQQYLLDNGLKEPFRSIVKTAEQSGTYIVGLINDYLDLQRAESETLTANVTPVEIRQLLSGVVSIVTAGKKEQVASIKLVVDPNISQWALLDEKKTRQILVNLIGNAVKYTAKGYIKVSVFSQGTETDPELCVQIEDTGIGIAETELEFLFDRFTRSEGAESKAGSGLGLAITKMLVDVLGGQIEVRSMLGEGSVFTVILPTTYVDESTYKLETELSHKLKSHDDVTSLKNLSILVADDISVNRILLNAMLSPIVKSVEMVEDGKEALLALRGGDFDLVIMDIHMPVLSGLDAADKMQEDERLREIPIIFLTGEDRDKYRKLVQIDTPHTILGKPVDLDTLLAEMTNVTANSKSP